MSNTPTPMDKQTAMTAPTEQTGWTVTTSRKHSDVCRPDGSLFLIDIHPNIAKDICDRFNELDRLRSYQGKVPSEKDIETKSREYYEYDLYFQDGAKWMHSEVAPIIAKLQSQLSDKEKEIEMVREALTELKAAYIKYGRHRDGCLKIEEGDECNCGYGKLLTHKQA